MLLLPGAAHPHPRRAPADLATWLGVPAGRVARWIDEGLPAAGGTLDAFQVVNWLNGRTSDVPVLAARWRRFLRWFQPFVDGRDRAMRRKVVRRHRLFLPRNLPAQDLTVSWWLPRLAGERWDVPVEEGVTHVRLASPSASAEVEVACMPVTEHQPDLLPLVEEVVVGFTYGYRHHRPDDEYHGRTEGSCLDLAFALGDRLTEVGRPWRLCSGVIAHTALANPHFWLEVETPDRGWATVDPSLPAIARTFAALGGADWREWARAYTGGRDARRIVLQRGDAPVRGIPGGATLGSHIGEAIVETEQGQANAWPCIDWVCGECRWEFS